MRLWRLSGKEKDTSLGVYWGAEVVAVAGQMGRSKSLKQQSNV